MSVTLGALAAPFCAAAARLAPRRQLERPVKSSASPSERRDLAEGRRGAGALRDGSRLPRRRQDRDARRHAGDRAAPATWWPPDRATSACRSKARGQFAAATSISSRPPPTPAARLLKGRASPDRRLRPQEGGNDSRRPARPRAALARAGAQPVRLCRAQGRRRRRHHRDAGRGRPGGRDRAAGGTARAPRREGSRGRAAGDLARRGAPGHGDGAIVVRPRAPVPSEAARALAASRFRHPHLRGALHHSRRQ